MLGALEWLIDAGIDDYCLMSMSSSNDDEYWMTCMRNLNDCNEDIEHCWMMGCNYVDDDMLNDEFLEKELGIPT